MLLGKNSFPPSVWRVFSVVPVIPRIACFILDKIYSHISTWLFLSLFQPIKLGDHLNSILLGMCEDVIYARVSVRTVLDACSAHIRNSNCAPSFSYVKQLVKLVLGNLSGVSYRSTGTYSHIFKCSSISQNFL